MTLYALDIETVGNLTEDSPLTVALLEKARSKIKLQKSKAVNPKPETLAKYEADYLEGIRSVEATLYEKAPLSPITGRVASVTIGVHEKGDAYINCIVNRNDERSVLEQFAAWYGGSTTSKDKLVTFNGRTFDIPFLGVRFMSHKIYPAMPWPRPRDWDRVVDVRDFFGDQTGKLDDYLMAMGIAPKVASGAEVETMTDEEIEKYTVAEMESFLEMMGRMVEVGMLR